MPTAPTEILAADAPAGFRLHRLEVYNWGTFHRRVWHIAPGGRNALLTGDIGSGKSTLVDAVTTLLVPHNRIVYNKAAGAEGKERDLYSYLRGQYKNEKLDSSDQVARPVYLRDENAYSVLLGHFYNQGFDQHVTLAQVFWLKDQQRNPERFFALAERELNITEHFGGFGPDIAGLKKQLRKLGVQIKDNFKEYSTRFRQWFGIGHEQALHLFYQTVSMKSVGNLTDFVRNHMLEASEVDARIEDLRQSFDNLNRCHAAVVNARRQIEMLGPLLADGDACLALGREVDGQRRCRDGLEAYFAKIKIRLLRVRLAELQQQSESNASRLRDTEEALHGARRRHEALQKDLEAQGGGRLRGIDAEISRLQAELQARQARHQGYLACLERLDIPAVSGEAAFYDTRRSAQQRLADIETRQGELEQRARDQDFEFRTLRDRHARLAEELASLRQRQSNIPVDSLRIRAALLDALQVAERDLPFAGELLQVRAGEEGWAGAIERVLHGFGLSLLVPDALYPKLSRYVDATWLRGKLVYFRVREDEDAPPAEAAADSLPRKLEIKPDTPFYAWLERQLRARFDYVCCADLADFHRLPRALTRQGQIKAGRARHEKDDRYALDDPGRFVLGWRNREKVRALEAQQGNLEQRIRQAAAALGDTRQARARLDAQRDAVRDLLNYQNFNALNWQSCAGQIEDLRAEQRALQDSSDFLRALQEQARQAQAQVAELEARRDEQLKRDAELNAHALNFRNQHQEAEESLRHWQEPQADWVCAQLDALLGQTLGNRALLLKELKAREAELREVLKKRIDNGTARQNHLRDKTVKKMQEYKGEWRAETSEIDAALDALEEYRRMWQNLLDEDLPRHEQRFKNMLNEGTINQVAAFRTHLEKERHDTVEKIEAINRSLRDIEYDRGQGTYIELVPDKSLDADIRDFQRELRECLEYSLGAADDTYNEARYLKVKAIIDRFGGRDGSLEADRRWTRKVTDVRNWFLFAARERFREDGAEREFYSDSGGKSGGQKEKLAYTILASALAYQFGLEWNTARSRSFRFVVIDEAFGRGSDESTRYGLELFKKLQLQLLIVTPLQKTHIIEDYVGAVHYVHNEGGINSLIRNLSIADYRTEKHLRRQTPPA